MSANAVGFILAVIMMVIMAVWTAPDEPLRFLDAHGAFVVVVGTIVIAMISLPFATLKNFGRCLRVVLRRDRDERVRFVELFAEMAVAARNDLGDLKRYAEGVEDEFLRDAILLLADGLDGDALVAILRRRLEVQKERENAAAKMFKNLAKYPPACGLVGTVMGMIALLSTLGREGAAQKIGPAMAVALAATLYGVLVANFLLAPVADRLMARTQETIAAREMIVEGIILPRERTNSVIIREMMMSHLPPTMRGQVKPLSGGASAKGAAA